MGIHIQSLRANDLDSETIDQIYKVEQDMGARENGLGEYVICDNCGTISSKEDIYKGTPPHIKKLTVSKIEQILGVDTFLCPHCKSGKTNHIRGEECREHIQKNFALPDSFCTIMKEVDEKVVGFMYGYVAPIDLIYDSEFKVHFQPGVKDVIKQELDTKGTHEMFSLPSVGTDESHMSMFIMLRLMRDFFNSIPQKYDYLTGISETVVGGVMTDFYKYMGAINLKLKQKFPNLLLPVNNNIDILIQPNIVKTYRDTLINMKKVFHIYKK